MEKLLLIAIPDTDGVEQVARRLRLRTVLVQPEQYARSLGQLAGYPAAAAEETPALPLPETGLLVMCGLKNSHMDKLLAALRNAGIAIPHKAVLTSTNQNWNGNGRRWGRSDSCPRFDQNRCGGRRCYGRTPPPATLVPLKGHP